MLQVEYNYTGDKMVTSKFIGYLFKSKILLHFMKKKNYTSFMEHIFKRLEILYTQSDLKSTNMLIAVTR